MAKVSERTLNSIYKPILACLITDKIPNVRSLALNVVKNNPTVVDKQINEALGQLRDEKDLEVKAQLKTLVK